MQEKNIIHILWEDVESTEKNKTKIQVANWLNKDNLRGVYLLDNNVFYFCGNDIPNYIYTYIKKLYTKKGYTYLYQ